MKNWNHQEVKVLIKIIRTNMPLGICIISRICTMWVRRLEKTL